MSMETEDDYKKLYENLKEKTAPLLNFFNFRKVNNITGTFNDTVDNFAISMLSNGKAGTAIFQFFKELSKLFSVLLEEGEVERRLPSLRYIQELRDCIPYLLEKQDKCFISESKKLVVATDATSNLNEKAIQAVSLYDENNRFHCIGYTQARNFKVDMVSANTKSFKNRSGFIAFPPSTLLIFG